MTEEDEQYIAASQESETWIPEELFPSLYHIDFNARASLGLKYQPGFDPETSLGLRYRGHIVGWLIGHRLDSATLRFSSVWVRQDLQRVGRFVPLIGLVVEGGKRAAASGVERVIWLTSVEHPEMVRFTQKWVAPYAAFYGETRGTTKSISP
jgi:hypothetical protein